MERKNRRNDAQQSRNGRCVGEQNLTSIVERNVVKFVTSQWGPFLPISALIQAVDRTFYWRFTGVMTHEGCWEIEQELKGSDLQAFQHPAW